VSLAGGAQGVHVFGDPRKGRKDGSNEKGPESFEASNRGQKGGQVPPSEKTQTSRDRGKTKKGKKKKVSNLGQLGGQLLKNGPKTRQRTHSRPKNAVPQNPTKKIPMAEKWKASKTVVRGKNNHFGPNGRGSVEKRGGKPKTKKSR